ncbi:TPA: restriction endonuclease, partial [Streptococcus equi subsp. zooepidemicus]
MRDNKILRPEYIFEQYVSNLFNKSGYQIVNEADMKEVKSNLPSRRADIIAKKEEKIYCIEVKFSTISEKTIEQVYSYISGTDMIPVIVTAFEVKEEEKSIYKNKYPELEIIDISNLLYVVKDTDKLKYELISILPFSVEDISPQ